MSYPDPVDTLARTQRLLMQAQTRIRQLEKQLKALKPLPEPVKEVVPEAVPVTHTPEVADTESEPLQVPKKKKKNGPTE